MNSSSWVAKRYAMVEEAAMEGIYEWFIDRNEIYVSPRLHKIFGFEPGEFGPKDWRWNERIHPDDVGDYKKKLDAYINSPSERWEYEYRFRDKTGDYRWVLDRGVSVRDDTDKAVRLVGAISDITPSKEHEAELDRKSKLLELILENIDQGISVMNADLKFAAFNSKFLELHRFPPDKFKVGDPVEEAVRYNANRGEYGEGDVEALVKQRLQQISTFKPDSYERARADGTVLEVRHTPLPGGGYVSTYTDITKRKQTEQALRESEDRYELAMQSVNEGIYDWDIKKDRIYYSDRVIKALGLVPSELKTLEDWSDRIHPDDIQTFRDAVIAHLKGKTERLEVEYRYRDMDEKWRWASQRGIALRDDTGYAYRMIGSTGDITALREKEAEVREQAEILKLILDTMNQGISVVNQELEVIAFNNKFLELLALPPDQFKPGFKMEQAFRYNAKRGEYGDGDIEDIVQQRLALTRKFEPHEFERTRPDGTVIEVWGSPTRSGGFISTYTDITERRKAERSLRESEERYALATESANEGIWDWDVKAKTIYVSDRLKELLGLKVADNVVTAEQWQSRIHPDDREKMRAAVAAHLRGETDFYRCELRTVDGDKNHERWIVHSGSVLRDDEGWVYRMAGSIGDITQMVEARQKAEQAHQLASERNRALESLSSKLAKYLSPQVYSSIFTGQTEVKISAERKKLTVLFSDIVDFAETTDNLEPEELTTVLNRYLTEMSKIALEHGATIDKYIGDAILMFFGDPKSKGEQEDAQTCVDMAVAMQRRMQELQVEWQDLGIPNPFQTRIGICTGYCTVGNFGSDDRMDYTIIGNPVNVSARIQSLAEPGEIILTFETHSLVKNRYVLEEKDPVTVKGLLRPVRIFRVVQPLSDVANNVGTVDASQDGLHIHIDTDRINPEDRQKTIQKLETALALLKKGE